MIRKKIASSSNPVFKTLVECLAPKGVKKHGLFIVSGDKAVRDLLRAHPERLRDLLICTDRGGEAHGSDLIEMAGAKSPATCIDLAKALFDELDIFGTRSPLLVLNAWEIPSLDLKTPPQGLEILCALQDPSNLGACLRSAAAFGASKFVLLRESASPFHPRAGRAASASTFATPLFRGPSILELGIDSGSEPERASTNRIYALDMEGEPLNTFSWPMNARLLVGEEGRGVPEYGAGVRKLSIPIAASVESLNAAVALSIALYSYQTRAE